MLGRHEGPESTSDRRPFLESWKGVFLVLLVMFFFFFILLFFLVLVLESEN